MLYILSLYIYIYIYITYIGTCVNLIFGTAETSLVTQIPDWLVNKRGWEKVRAMTMKGIDAYLQKLMSRGQAKLLAPYTQPLLGVCKRLIRGDTNSTSRACSCDIVWYLFKRQFIKEDRYEASVSPSSFIDMFFKELNVAKSKQTATVRGCILRTLGKLSQQFAKQIKDKAPTLARIYMETLEAETKKNKVEANLISGVFTGLTFFLDNYNDLIVETARKKSMRLSTLFAHLMGGLAAFTLNKYDIVRSALALFSRHASLFKDFFVEGSSSLFETLLACSRHSNAGVQGKGAQALEAYLTQVSKSFVEEEKLSEERLSEFTVLLRYFNNKLEDATVVTEVDIYFYERRTHTHTHTHTHRETKQACHLFTCKYITHMSFIVTLCMFL